MTRKTWPWTGRDLKLPASTIQWLDKKAAAEVEEVFSTRGGSPWDRPSLKTLIGMLQKYCPGRWARSNSGRKHERPYLGGWAWWEAVRKATTSGVAGSTKIAPWPPLVRPGGAVPIVAMPPSLGGMLDVDVGIRMGLSDQEVRDCVDKNYGREWGSLRESYVKEAKRKHGWLDEPDLPIQRLKGDVLGRLKAAEQHPYISWTQASAQGESRGSAPSPEGVDWGEWSLQDSVRRRYERDMVDHIDWGKCLELMCRLPPNVTKKHCGVTYEMPSLGGWDYWKWARLSRSPCLQSQPFIEVSEKCEPRFRHPRQADGKKTMAPVDIFLELVGTKEEASQLHAHWGAQLASRRGGAGDYDHSLDLPVDEGELEF